MKRLAVLALCACSLGACAHEQHPPATTQLRALSRWVDAVITADAVVRSCIGDATPTFGRSSWRRCMGSAGRTLDRATRTLASATAAPACSSAGQALLARFRGAFSHAFHLANARMAAFDAHTVYVMTHRGPRAPKGHSPAGPVDRAETLRLQIVHDLPKLERSLRQACGA